ncbi:unnamed protein product [Rangifer tarandus platyrhynchus]|uniref:Uncharacterized protein n=2 Tax=Rangifer tarandus platyrhynchus TaxID=3082113 RepID=A0ACB0FG27_RANTA|nr:unnamed protein product [Rangifer tarandus platyrhynchus]CAI9711468.1 unnamed protein product [Rangifer tarandus platyrhynchus]
MSLPSLVPAPEQSSCAPLSAPSLSPSCLWGGAGQLGNSCKAWGGGGGGGVRVPSRKSRKQSPCPGRVQGEAHLARPAECGADPRSKPPPGFKGVIADFQLCADMFPSSAHINDTLVSIVTKGE